MVEKKTEISTTDFFIKIPKSPLKIFFSKRSPKSGEKRMVIFGGENGISRNSPTRFHLRKSQPTQYFSEIPFPVSIIKNIKFINRCIFVNLENVNTYRYHSKKFSNGHMMALMSQPEWLISDLIPKKSEKFEFRKFFVTIFSSVKN